jgi:hypothetical protein
MVDVAMVHTGWFKSNGGSARQLSAAMLRLVATAQAQGGMARRVATQFASLRQLRPLRAASTDQQVGGMCCGMPQ